MNWQPYKPSPLGGIPTVTKYLLSINIVLFAAKFFFSNKIPLDQYLDLFYFKSTYFKPYQIITHMFMHGNFGHILFNMLGLYSFGILLESIWGQKKFLNFYLICGIGAAVAHQASIYYEISDLAGPELFLSSMIMDVPMLGASGAIMGLLGAVAVMFPNMQMRIFMLPPLKAKYVAVIYGVASVVFGTGSFMQMGGGIAHFAHLGGLLIGAGITFYWRYKGKTFL